MPWWGLPCCHSYFQCLAPFWYIIAAFISTHVVPHCPFWQTNLIWCCLCFAVLSSRGILLGMESLTRGRGRNFFNRCEFDGGPWASPRWFNPSKEKSHRSFVELLKKNKSGIIIIHECVMSSFCESSLVPWGSREIYYDVQWRSVIGWEDDWMVTIIGGVNRSG